MAKKKPPPPNVPLMQGNMVHPMWAEFFENLRPIAATQSDLSSVSDPPTQAEVNAIVTAFNALIDALQAAGLME